MASKSARTRSAAKRAPAPTTEPGVPPAPGAAPTLDGTADGEPLRAKHARKIPMFVDSTVHLPGEEDKEGRQRAPIVITGGRMLDEVQDDLDEPLDDDQIDELIALRAIRPATQAEIAAADARAEAED
jgi:hypothetical protein